MLVDQRLDLLVLREVLYPLVVLCPQVRQRLLGALPRGGLEAVNGTAQLILQSLRISRVDALTEIEILDALQQRGSRRLELGGWPDIVSKLLLDQRLDLLVLREVLYPLVVLCPQVRQRLLGALPRGGLEAVNGTAQLILQCLRISRVDALTEIEVLDALQQRGSRRLERRVRRFVDDWCRWCRWCSSC